jgi:hypothetical protein
LFARFSDPGIYDFGSADPHWRYIAVHPWARATILGRDIAQRRMKA